MKFRYSRHAEEELVRRNIHRALADAVLRHPQQIVPERGSRSAYQSKVDFGGERTFLLRLIVDETTDPVSVVTAYRTSKINKYWRQK